MRPSVVLDMKRSAVREAVGRFRAANPRVFGSVLHGTDRDGSDLDLLVDALPGATLLDLGDLEEELKSLLGVDVDLLTPGDFLADKRTQQAVIMSLIVIGEAATKVMDGYVEFTQAHADVPWRSMRNMRNRMAHGYFDINLDVVWETVQEWLPALLQQLPAVRQDADDEDRNDKGMEP